MGYGLSIYCEPEIFYKQELIEELNKLFPPDGEYTSFAIKQGYYFFGNYRIYHEKTLFYSFCREIESDFYKYFDTIDYLEDLEEWMQKGITFNWLNLNDFKIELNVFFKKLSELDRENIFNKIATKDNEFQKYREKELKRYFIREEELLEDLKVCLTYLQIFDRYGAKSILITYD